MKLYGMEFHSEGYLIHFIAASHDIEKLKNLIPGVTWRNDLVDLKGISKPKNTVCYAETNSRDSKYTIAELPYLS